VRRRVLPPPPVSAAAARSSAATHPQASVAVRAFALALNQYNKISNLCLSYCFTSPNGNLLAANGDAVNADVLHPSEIVEFTKWGQFVREYNVDSSPGGAFGID